MTDLATLEEYGVLAEPATLTMKRLLPGPIERVWSYITDSQLRAKWLAAGVMELRVGAPFELVWHNDDLTDPPGKRPPGFDAEHRMQSRITELDAPHKLSFTFSNSSDVTLELSPQGDQVLLTVTHRRLPDRKMMLGVSAGWHSHLNVLVARMLGNQPLPFWDDMSRLRAEYDRRLPN